MHLVCRGRLHNFKFTDELDCDAESETFATGNGVTKIFQLGKISVIDGVSYTRKCYVIRAAAVTDNGIAVTPTLDDRRFWELCAERRLCFQRCADCKTLRHPPAPMCSRCQSTRSEWTDAPRVGTLFSYTVVHHPSHAAASSAVPYNIVLVEFEGLDGVLGQRGFRHQHGARNGCSWFGLRGVEPGRPEHCGWTDDCQLLGDDQWRQHRRRERDLHGKPG